MRKVPKKRPRRFRGDSSSKLIPGTTVPRREIRVVYVSVTKLKVWDKNPRDNDDAADRLTSLFAEYGFVDPIIATRDNVVRAGHTRLKSAIRSGMKKVPVIYIDFKSEEQAQLFSIAHNKSHEWAQWVPEQLQSLFLDLQSVGTDELMTASGFTPLELEGLRALPEEPVGEAPARRKAGKGSLLGTKQESDYWVFFVAPDKETYNNLLQRFGVNDPDVVGGKRRLDWNKVAFLFGFKNVPRKEAGR